MRARPGPRRSVVAIGVSLVLGALVSGCSSGAPSRPGTDSTLSTSTSTDTSTGTSTGTDTSTGTGTGTASGSSSATSGGTDAGSGPGSATASPIAEPARWQPIPASGGDAAYRLAVPARATPRLIALPIDPLGPGREPIIRESVLRVVAIDGSLVTAAALEPPGAGELTIAAGGRPAVLLAPGAATTLTVRIADRLIASAVWRDRAGVRSLQVTPTWVARGWAGGGDAVWAALRATRPDADTPGMRDQLVCHVQFAPGKPSWFLEPARPAVGYAATVAAACNPGDLPDGG
mgnify:CR=1 FL=1|jgi:hypothetical protein